MIHAVTANMPSFREVHFRPGLNIILADRSTTASVRDSRNSLGKTTLLAIIDFCLGSSITNKSTPCVPALSGWEFTLTFDLDGKKIQVTRSVDENHLVRVSGNDLPSWPVPPNSDCEQITFHVDSWCVVLGFYMFGLDRRTSGVSFRSLIGYFLRVNKDSYDEPFQFFKQQSTISKLIHTSFLLNLSWQLAAEWGNLAKAKAEVRILEKAIKEIGGDSADCSLGALDAKRVQLATSVRVNSQGLKSFRVTPNYRDLEQQANDLTGEIQKAHNDNALDANTLKGYEKSIASENYLGEDKLISLYRSARIELPGIVTARLRDVRKFHRTVVSNRREFLQAEAQNLRAVIKDRTNQLATLIETRAKLMEILRTSGALDEYTKLQEAHIKQVESLKSIEQRIESLRSLGQKGSAVRVEKELLFTRTVQDLQDRSEQKDAAITFFDENSRFLYHRSGVLKIEANPNGLNFDVNIPARDSHGVGNMQIFCFDIAVAQLWSSRDKSPGFIAHDSIIFADVDERQRAKALELAKQESNRLGFQYICTYNSDNIPTCDFSEDFSVEDHVVLRLTDDTDAGSLLGIRFER